MRPDEAAALIARVKDADKARKAYGRRYAVLYEALLEDDPEALAYIAEWLDPAAIEAARKAKRAEDAAVREEARYEAQALDLADASYRGPAALRRAAKGRLVWLYHGTSSRFVDAILQDGLRHGIQRIDAKQVGVFLTARPGGGLHDGGTAAWYARRAAARFGGDPVVLRVRVPFDDVEMDADDADIAAGDYQFVVDYVPPEDVCEVNGNRVGCAFLSRPPMR